MEILRFDYSLAQEVTGNLVDNTLKEQAVTANRKLEDGTGKGSDYLGWVNLPSQTGNDLMARIKETANRLRSKCEIVVCVGIGGSYLGTRAILEAMSDPFGGHSGPRLLFAGQNLSEDYMASLLAHIAGKSFGIIVISKSGTTTEPAIAFRILREEIEKRYGAREAAERIVAITDGSRGALKKMADQKGYATFEIPDNVGGRYSVLTPVGLVPLAVAGIDVGKLIEGAHAMEEQCGPEVGFENNPACRYAAVRNALYSKGYRIEILASYEPAMQYVAEWWKQLYGESEGKEGKGIFPASVTYTADLHSMGQYVQQGERTLFETVIRIGAPNSRVEVPLAEGDGDGLNFLAGRRLSQINRQAETAVSIAHTDGGVPNTVIEIPAIDEFHLGALLYFFEKACGISGYMLGVNPFDQPGVEDYKVNMFALLGKPGYQEKASQLRERIGKQED